MKGVKKSTKWRKRKKREKKRIPQISSVSTTKKEGGRDKRSVSTAATVYSLSHCVTQEHFSKKQNREGRKRGEEERDCGNGLAGTGDVEKKEKKRREGYGNEKGHRSGSVNTFAARKKGRGRVEERREDVSLAFGRLSRKKRGVGWDRKEVQKRKGGRLARPGREARRHTLFLRREKRREKGKKEGRESGASRSEKKKEGGDDRE